MRLDDSPHPPDPPTQPSPTQPAPSRPTPSLPTPRPSDALGRDLRVLICGSRDWTDDRPILTILDGLLFLHNCGFGTVTLEPLAIIEGGAKGADEIAAAWAETWKEREPYEFGVPRLTHEQYPADWYTHDYEGKTPVPCRHRRLAAGVPCLAAGLRRNQKMMDEAKPSVAFAFVTRPLPESRGTADMVRRLKVGGVTTYVMQLA